MGEAGAFIYRGGGLGEEGSWFSRTGGWRMTGSAFQAMDVVLELFLEEKKGRSLRRGGLQILPDGRAGGFLLGP